MNLLLLLLFKVHGTCVLYTCIIIIRRGYFDRIYFGRSLRLERPTDQQISALPGPTDTPRPGRDGRTPSRLDRRPVGPIHGRTDDHLLIGRSTRTGPRRANACGVRRRQRPVLPGDACHRRSSQSPRSRTGPPITTPRPPRPTTTCSLSRLGSVRSTVCLVCPLLYSTRQLNGSPLLYRPALRGEYRRLRGVAEKSKGARL